MNEQKLYQGAKWVRSLFRNKQVNFSLKLIFVLLLGYALYRQTIGKDNFSEILATFQQQLRMEYIYFLALAIVLMPVNWLLETIKWKTLVDHIEKVPLLRAFKGVFAGVALSIFTPNRIGEYGGRILVVKPENNIKTVVATIVGSFSQLVVLLVMGMLGMTYFIYLKMDADIMVQYGIGFSSMLITVLLVFFYLNVDLIIPIFNRLPLFNRLVKHIGILKTYSSKTLTIVLGFSLIRYLVYSIQYFLLLQFFGIDLSILQGLASIATIFLIQTSIPLPPISGLLVRGEVALHVWGYFQINELSILAATFSLWFINVILPALFGMIFILNVNVLKSLGYEETTD